jgi:hypothetical protein
LRGGLNGDEEEVPVTTRVSLPAPRVSRAVAAPPTARSPAPATEPVPVPELKTYLKSYGKGIAILESRFPQKEHMKQTNYFSFNGFIGQKDEDSDITGKHFHIVDPIFMTPGKGWAIELLGVADCEGLVPENTQLPSLKLAKHVIKFKFVDNRYTESRMTQFPWSSGDKEFYAALSHKDQQVTQGV